jgi:predicted CoA-binding protein
MRTSRKAIEHFIAPRTLAIAGVSRNRKKFGYTVFNELKKRGFTVYPVNPYVDLIDEVTCYRSVSALPQGVDNLLVVTPKSETPGVVKEAVDRGIRNIWIQQLSDTPEALQLAAEKQVNLVSGQCILMWSEPVKGIHRFHRTLKGLFGLLPG